MAVIHLGKVKWFGGHNSKTGRDNDFGFIDFVDGESVFVHRSSIINCTALDEGDLVLFSTISGKRGFQAENVCRLIEFDDLSLDFLCNLNDDELTKARELSIAPILSYLVQGSSLAMLDASSSLKKLVKDLCQSKYGREFVAEISSIFPRSRHIADLISKCKNWDELFSQTGFGKSDFNDSIEMLGYELLPHGYITDNIDLLSQHLLTLPSDERISALMKLSHGLTFSSVLYLILSDASPHPKYWEAEKQGYHNVESFSELLRRFVEGIVGHENQVNVDDFVRNLYKERFKSFSEFCQHQVIAPLIQPCLIKRKIFLKDMSFVSEVRSDERMWNDPEMWFLCEIIPLVFAGNAHDDVEKVILHKLWEALLSNHISIDHPSIFKLFPQCETLKSNFTHLPLSCEAFHWSPKDGRPKFLCRSRVCHDPQVIPELNKSYFNYSVFDWLAHYGINYMSEHGPSKRDFSIKLAGYFNRVRELHAKLNCRCCGNLMAPDLKYARVEVKTIDPQSKQVVVTPVNAAYRLTVFECNTESCIAYGKKHYINHCLHYKCFELIDSRDMHQKCSRGRYICKCGACCDVHSSNEGTINGNQTLKHRELYQDSPSLVTPYGRG